MVPHQSSREEPLLDCVPVAGVGPAGWMDASPEVLRSVGGAPYIHDRLTRYMITPYGGKVMMGQLISQQFHTAADWS